MSLPPLVLRCPRCKMPLIPTVSDSLRCTRAGQPHTYPIVVGIPDLRINDDPRPALGDRIAAERLESQAAALTFAGLADAYRAELPASAVECGRSPRRSKRRSPHGIRSIVR